MGCRGEPLFIMAKIYGLFGTMKGKVADVVMTVRNGEQIVRKYQPQVYNPNTPAQVETRAKLKALSQLSAVLAPAIAIPRNGAVSTRNLFTKLNYGLVTFSNDTASIDLVNVQLTKSVVSFPDVGVQRTENNFALGLQNVTPLEIDRVVYVVLAKGEDNKLRYVESAVVSTPGERFNFQITIPSVPQSCVVYGYGIRDNNERARVVFGNLSIISAETIATLLTNRTLLEADVTLTETRGTNIAAVS